MGTQKEKKDFEKILEVITGEKALREKEKQLKKMKSEAIKEQKDKRRKGIVEGVLKLEKDPIQERKVVQNIKLFEWSAPDRHRVSFTNKKFLIVLALALLFSLYLAILGNYLLMASILAILFLLYIAGTTKPITVKHKITARGVDTGGKLYEWYMLDSFFFSKKDKTYFLVINSKLNFPSALILLFKEKDKDALFVLLQEQLLYEDIRKWRWLDKVSYGEYIPLEKL